MTFVVKKMTENTTDDLLRGVRVLDLSQYIPGPYASLLMARQGADVVKIEAPSGDPMRFLGTGKGEISPLYTWLNQGKRVVTLNLKSDEGQKMLESLVERADVLLEGFRPGTLDRLGLGYPRLQQLNPQLVICSLSGYGQTGEYAQRAGHDLGYGARAGLYSQASVHGEPQLIYPPVADHAAALNALAMINGALYRRARSGRGCVLDISICGTLADWSYALADRGIAGQLSGDLASYRGYRSSDQQYLTLAALEPKFWQAFNQAVERPDWLARHTEEPPQRALTAELEALFGSRPLSHWQSLLGEVDCCFEVVPAVSAVPGAQHPAEQADICVQRAEQINWSE